jgi:hypothetical protein
VLGRVHHAGGGRPMIGATVSDLEEGDVLPAVDYRVSDRVAREYARASEWPGDEFHGPPEASPRYAPPSLIHALKLVLLRHSCPDGAGPTARMHYEYDATHHGPILIGSTLRLSGRVESMYVRRGRRFMKMLMDVQDSDTGDLVATYCDTSLLQFAPVSSPVT